MFHHRTESETFLYFIVKKGYFVFKLFLIFVLSQPEIGTCTISDHPEGVLIYLYPSGSTLSLVSQQIFLPLINRLYSDHLGFLYTQTTQSSFASSKSNFLFGYSNLLAHLNFWACFCCWAFFAAIHLLFVLEAIIINNE